MRWDTLEQTTGLELGCQPWLFWRPFLGADWGVPPTNEAMGNVFMTDWVGMYYASTGD